MAATIISTRTLQAGLTFTRRDTSYGAVEYRAPLPQKVWGSPYYGTPGDECVEAVVWYDRYTRNWTGWLADRCDYQQTHAVYGSSREDIADEIALLYRSCLPENR